MTREWALISAPNPLLSSRPTQVPDIRNITTDRVENPAECRRKFEPIALVRSRELYPIGTISIRSTSTRSMPIQFFAAVRNWSPGAPTRPLAWIISSLLLTAAATAQEPTPNTFEEERIDLVDRGDRAAFEDSGRIELRNQLDSLVSRRLPSGIKISSLFGIRLDDRSAVSARIGELKAQRSALSARVIELTEAGSARDTRLDALDPSSAPDAESLDSELLLPNAEVDSARLDLEIINLRIAYLEPLLRKLEEMTDAAGRIFPTLEDERTSLRRHAGLLSEVGSATRGLESRLRTLARRSGSGLLVGFVSERRELKEELELVAVSYRNHADKISGLAEQFDTLATSIESTGQQIRDRIFRSVIDEDATPELDEVFLSHLRLQRRLRKSVSRDFKTPSETDLEEFARETLATLSAPHEIGTTADAQVVLEQSRDLERRIQSLLLAEGASRGGWQLAFENEVVTVLSHSASPRARSTAYGFSSEIVDDAKSEIELAIARLREEARKRRAEIPSIGALFSTSVGQSYLFRGLGAFSIFTIWFLLRGQASRLTTFFVRLFARLPIFRTSVGMVVRWFGLIETILPALLALLAIGLASWVLGSDSAATQLLQVLAIPLALYWLGRQILIGTTRRIARGRPALIEVRPATLVRLERTYSTLGLVVTIGYMLGGLARIGIGAGRLVSLVNAAVFTWVAVWAAWEAVRWRVPLSEVWIELTPEEGPPGLERRVAAWMGAHRRGFLLSPIALLRVTGTRLARVVTDRAGGTSLIQSLRTQILRRRSMKVEAGDEKPAMALPQEYIDAFPLHPILGQDDGLLVPRAELLGEVLDQVSRWRESRADGSLALIGEQGVGKTTLAALIGGRVEDLDVVHHTVRGKPGTQAKFLGALTASLGLGDSLDIDEICQTLNDGPERLVLVDDAHNVFLRRVGGYEAYDALVELVNSTSIKVFWVLVFNSYTWRFLNETRGRVRYFRKLLYLPRWSQEEIQALIRLRHARTEFDLEFDEMLLSDERSNSNGFELVEGSDGYFRLLWDSSGGNPRIASQLWLASLGPSVSPSRISSQLSPVGSRTDPAGKRLQGSDKRLRVRPFRETNPELLSSLQDDLFFSLAAICQHENLTGDELGRVLNVPEQFAQFAVQFLTESGLLEHKDSDTERYTLSPQSYRAVLRVLKNKHLLFD